jgi:hypothetical protein
MPTYDRLYQFSERHYTYTLDTKVALDAIVAAARENAGEAPWAASIGFPRGTPVKDLPTQAFTKSAKLLQKSSASRGCLSYDSKLALDRAIRDRKEQAAFYQVISRKTKKETEIYKSHIYFIRVLTYIRQLLRYLFARPIGNAPPPTDTSDVEAGYELLLGLIGADLMTEPPMPPSVDEGAKSLAFWTRIYEFIDDMIEI